MRVPLKDGTEKGNETDDSRSSTYLFLVFQLYNGFITMGYMLIYAHICWYITTLYNVDMLIIRCEKKSPEKIDPHGSIQSVGYHFRGVCRKTGTWDPGWKNIDIHIVRNKAIWGWFSPTNYQRCQRSFTVKSWLRRWWFCCPPTKTGRKKQQKRVKKPRKS